MKVWFITGASRGIRQAIVILSCLLTAASVTAKDKYDHYLFCYFNGNATEEQQVWYAVSKDGINFTPLNDGKPVVRADTISVSGGVRDPHILRGEDGWFYQVLTDMDWQAGKWSNRGIIMMRSHDLVNWEHHTVQFPQRFAGTDFAKVNAVWAPQTIYDPAVGKYMVYFSLHSDKAMADSPFPTDVVYYAYANAAFSDLEGTPQRLFTYDGPAIDTDIVRDDAGTYHLFFNTWGGAFKGTGRREYVFTDLHAPDTWTLLPSRIQPTANNSEGSCAYPRKEGGWLMVYDCFQDSICQFCESADLVNFRHVADTKKSGSFTPRHGTVIPITKKEMKNIKKHLK